MRSNSSGRFTKLDLCLTGRCDGFFKKYNPFKAQITPHKSKKILVFYVSLIKKNHHTFKLNTPLIEPI